MKKDMSNKDNVIDLGHGFIYENGDIKKVITEDTVNNNEWLTHEECWQWVADSLKKIYKIDEDLL